MSNENAVGKVYRQFTPLQDIHYDCKANANPVTVIITDGKGFMPQDDIDDMYRLLGFPAPAKAKTDVSIYNFNEFQPNKMRFKQGRRMKTMETFLGEVERFPLPDDEISYEDITHRECTVSGRNRLTFNRKCQALYYPGSYFLEDIRGEKEKIAAILNNEIRMRNASK